jgi:hypothetical protein
MSLKVMSHVRSLLGIVNTSKIIVSIKLLVKMQHLQQ